VTPARRTAREADAGAIRVTQVHSAIGAKPKHRGTLRALGLRGVGRSRVLPDRPEIRGMLARVPHLVELSPATAEEAQEARARTQKVRGEHRAAERAARAEGGQDTKEQP
jgi:large subunit ribosomal protein L30